MPRVNSPTRLTEVAAQNIERLRLARHWTRDELAGRLTIAGWPMENRIPLDRLVKGVRVLTVDELAIVAEVFGVQPWSLTEPPHCDACLGSPPAGFTCNECGASR